jgi:hypothetical protein
VAGKSNLSRPQRPWGWINVSNDSDASIEQEIEDIIKSLKVLDQNRARYREQADSEETAGRQDGFTWKNAMDNLQVYDRVISDLGDRLRWLGERKAELQT